MLGLLAKQSVFDYAIGMTGMIFWLGLITIVFTYMTLWFGLALLSKRYDVVDTAWGLGFVLVAWVSLALSVRSGTGAVQIVSATLLSIWGFRLSAHIANRNWRKHTDDHRYETMRARWKGNQLRKSYTNIFLLQGGLILLVSLPMIAIASTHRTEPNAGVLVGWTIWVFGIVLEAVADYQLAKFIGRRATGSHAIMNKGLWQYSRHPNYFGEATSWWGAGIVAASCGAWWALLGSLAITVLVTKVSGVPPLEKHYEGNPEYAAYSLKTSVFIPLPAKKS